MEPPPRLALSFPRYHWGTSLPLFWGLKWSPARGSHPATSALQAAPFTSSVTGREIGIPGRTYTCDLPVRTGLLYDLSYGDMALREGFAPSTSSFAGWHSFSLSFRSMKMAGVMGLAPTWLQRDGLASRLLRLHAQMVAATGFAPVRPGSEPGRLLLPHAAMEQHGGSAPPTPVWKTGVCLSTAVLRNMVPRIGLAPMTSCSSGRRSNWTELPWDLRSPPSLEELWRAAFA